MEYFAQSHKTSRCQSQDSKISISSCKICVLFPLCSLETSPAHIYLWGNCILFAKDQLLILRQAQKDQVICVFSASVQPGSSAPCMVTAQIGILKGDGVCTLPHLQRVRCARSGKGTKDLRLLQVIQITQFKKYCPNKPPKIGHPKFFPNCIM